jgi:hypothetical protein
MYLVLNRAIRTDLVEKFPFYSKWPNFVLKMVTCAQFNFRIDFDRISSNLAKIRSMKFDQFEKISANFGVGSAKIGGGN